MANALQLDPVGVRQPLLAKAKGGGRPREEPVVGAPQDPNGAGDSLGIEIPGRTITVDVVRVRPRDDTKPRVKLTFSLPGCVSRRSSIAAFCDSP